MKKLVASLFLCAGVVALGALITLQAREIRLANAQGPPPKPEERLPNVAVVELKAESVSDYLVLTCGIEAWEAVTLSAETTGRIELQDIEEGDTVSKGQAIIEINTTSIQASIERDRARLALAEQELERVTELRGQGISSPQEFDRAMGDMQAAKANLKLTQIQLEQSVISAEIAGVVDTLYNEAGEFVSAGTHLVRIVQVDKVRAVVGMPERDVAMVSIGDTVFVDLDAYSGRTFEGKVFRIATSAEDATRTFATEVELDNPEGLLRPGMIARATFIRKTYESAITVPLFSVLTRNDGRIVFVEKDGVARMHPVEIGFFQGDEVHITGGLSEGDRLIVLGQRDLRDGDRVLVQSGVE